MNKVFEIIEAQKIFNISYKQLEIIVHPQSYLHALVKFNNGLIKLLFHDTNMKIPIFNSLYLNGKKKIKSENLNLKKLNNLDLKYIDKKRFPVVNILNKLKDEDTLFETIIVSANDNLVNLFLEGRIKFADISKILIYVLNMSEFDKYKKITPKNIDDIIKLSNYVSLKINNMSI
jgi:1-deoxy-D-xylulose-5-phosphate reductoisomerase